MTQSVLGVFCWLIIVVVFGVNLVGITIAMGKGNWIAGGIAGVISGAISGVIWLNAIPVFFSSKAIRKQLILFEEPAWKEKNKS